MNPIDTYRDAFLKFVADGMSYAEAEDQFDKAELRAAVEAELKRGDCRQVINSATLEAENVCGHETLFDLCVKARFERRNGVDGPDFQQALELWQAGWTSESPKPSGEGFWGQPQVMAWYWRRPSRRPGKPGRKYLSTNQAWNALKRESQK